MSATITATRKQWHDVACDLMHRKLTESADHILVALGPILTRRERPNEPLTLTIDETTANGYLLYELTTYYPKYHNFPSPTA